ncbi:MAG: hypothetical protein Q9225_000126 [Loekoesia sp. 1 TL-2023]
MNFLRKPRRLAKAPPQLQEGTIWPMALHALPYQCRPQRKADADNRQILEPTQSSVLLLRGFLLLREPGQQRGLDLELLEAHAQQNQIDDDLIPHVQSLSDACHKEIDYLNGVLNKIAASGTSSRAKKAFRAMRHEKDVQRSAATLKDCFSILFTVYQINFIPLRQASLKVENVDSNDVESLVTIDEPAQAVQEVQTALITTKEEEQHMLQQTTLMADRCNCRRREVVQSLKSWSLGSASVSSEILTQHRSGCPFYVRYAEQYRHSFSLKYTNVMLRIIARVTMSMKYGAGGLSLSPNLTLRGIKREDSPASRLFDNAEWEGSLTAADATAKITQTSLRLQQMFDERVASPFELDQEGNSLVWVAYKPLLRCYLDWHCRDFTEKRIGLLKFLRNSGVPLNDISGSFKSRTLLTHYIHGIEDEFNPEFIAFLMDWAVLNCNTLQLAILQRTESQVEDIIRVNPSAVQFQNALRQSPLHVAADWPWATALLLNSGADPYQVDISDCTAIDYACWLKSYEVVRILLEAGSPLLANRLLGDIVACRISNYDKQFFKLIISHLFIRRRELLQIARTLLPETTLSSIVPPNEAVPDSSSYQLIKAVCAAGHATKPEYWLQDFQGLYQSYRMFPAAADVLYEAGFRYLEGRDDMGETPLTCQHTSAMNTSAMTVWLYRRGVSFTEWTRRGKNKEYPASSMPSMYWAILELAYSMYTDKAASKFYGTLSLYKMSEDDFEALNIFLKDEFSECRDLCHCLCCSRGCSPEVIILKTILTRPEHWNRFFRPSVHLLPRFLQLADETIFALMGDGRCTRSSLFRLNQAAIRMALFLDLGLRHLCCQLKDYRKISPPICKEEADEIREEDRYLAEQFKTLLPKAQSEWKESRKELAGFWRDFHRANICRQHDGPLDELELERLRELGVMVHEGGDEEMDCDSTYGDEEGYCESLHSNEEETEVNDTE